MGSRHREQRDNAGLGYRHINSNNSDTYQSLWSKWSSADDVIAKGNGHDLTIRHVTRQGGLYTRTTSGSLGRVYENYLPLRFANPADGVFAPKTVSGEPSDSSLAASLLASTNPSRPVIDLPIFVFELREIPKLLKLEGDTFLRKAGSANLSYQFGIRPLVNDLANLLNFGDAVKKREKELEELAKSGLRRKRQLWDGTSTTSDSVILNSDGFTLNGVGNYTTTKKCWGYVEWFPLDPPALMKADKRALARKAVLGLTIDFSTAWNAIPWSWLVDWCTNVGDVLIANRNLVGAGHGPIQIMRQSQTMCDWTLSGTAASFTSKPCRHQTVQKTRRTVASVSLSAQLPILTWRQLSILGSIGVTRRLPKSL